MIAVYEHNRSRFSIKIKYYQYKSFHHKYKMVSLPSYLLYWNGSLISATKQTKVPTQNRAMITKNSLLGLTYNAFVCLRAPTHAAWALALSWQTKLGRHWSNTDYILAGFGAILSIWAQRKSTYLARWLPAHKRSSIVVLAWSYTLRRITHVPSVRGPSHFTMHIHIYAYSHIYIYIYIYVCVCVNIKYSVHQPV